MEAGGRNAYVIARANRRPSFAALSPEAVFQSGSRFVSSGADPIFSAWVKITSSYRDVGTLAPSGGGSSQSRRGPIAMAGTGEEMTSVLRELKRLRQRNQQIAKGNVPPKGRQATAHVLQDPFAAH